MAPTPLFMSATRLTRPSARVRQFRQSGACAQGSASALTGLPV
jgi:hypothetical protein